MSGTLLFLIRVDLFSFFYLSSGTANHAPGQLFVSQTDTTEPEEVFVHLVSLPVHILWAFFEGSDANLPTQVERNTCHANRGRGGGKLLEEGGNSEMTAIIVGE